MMEELATVVAVDAGEITVQSTVKSACGGCQQVEQCGSGQVAKAFPQKQLSATVHSDLPVKVGDQVVLAIPERALLNTAWQVYIWPLLGLILCSGLGQYLLLHGYVQHELLAVFFGAVGGYLGFYCARRWQARSSVQREIMPSIVRIVPVTIPVTEIV